MSFCEITPISAFMSTNLNSQIECYQRLGQRILRTLGHPMINIEIHPDQLYEAISMSIDFFTKYAGYTKETLIFDSRLYEKNVGIRLDHLFTVANTGYTPSQILENRKIGPDPDFNVEVSKTLYISQSAIPQSYFISSPTLSAAVTEEGIEKMQLINEETYNELLSFDPNLGELFIPSKQKNFTVQCENQDDVKSFNNMFDYDVLDYRKVIDVIRFEEGSTTGVNNLFSMESFMQQQSYFSFSLGNYGFDMLSWHTTKDWIDTREKIFATRRDIHFDGRTQYLRFFPQPKNSRFYGVIECYVERPIRDLVKEKWVLEYSTALVKIMWGRILTKVNGVTLLGGGTLNGDTVLSEGVSDKERLETFLIEGGYGDYDPIMFFVS
jgi:hypothetical protein